MWLSPGPARSALWVHTYIESSSPALVVKSGPVIGVAKRGNAIAIGKHDFLGELIRTKIWTWERSIIRKVMTIMQWNGPSYNVQACPKLTFQGNGLGLLLPSILNHSHIYPWLKVGQNLSASPLACPSHESLEQHGPSPPAVQCRCTDAMIGYKWTIWMDIYMYV